AFEAAKLGTKEVSMAITASTLTTVAVFFPLVFVEGIAGQLFRDQALTVTFALLASLVVALTLIPTMAAREQQRQGNKQEKATDSVADSSHLSTSKTTKKPWYYWPTWPLRLVARAFKTSIIAIITVITLLSRLVSRFFALLFKPLIAAVSWLL